MIKKHSGESYIQIFAEEITVNVRIGLFAHEAKPQQVRVCFTLHAAPSYLNGVNSKNIIDYKKIYDAVQSWQGREHVKLLETYLRELLDLSFGFKEVMAADVSVAKTQIFPHVKAVGVGAYMTRKEYQKI